MRREKLLPLLILFVGINILLYLYIVFFYDKVKFRKPIYYYNAHHYFVDPRARGGDFEFLRAMGQFDAQWYLKIASEGYPKNPTHTNIEDKRELDGLTYAFFPLYPLILKVLNFGIRNIELTAFILANVLMIANFISIYFVITKLYSENTAAKTIFLLFLFPFSIFYRSYFTEGLFLLLLIWFAYFLIKKQRLLTSFALSLLMITRPNGIFLIPIFLFFLLKDIREHRSSLIKAVGAFVLASVPLLFWILYNSIQTGDFLYWYKVQSEWYKFENLSFPLITNLKTIISYRDLPLHFFHGSRIDVLTILIVFALLIVSRKKLNPVLWLISLVLWLFPLLLKDTMSFSRYQVVSFPLFLYLAKTIKGEYYIALAVVFLAGLFWLSLYFVNWWWIG